MTVFMPASSSTKNKPNILQTIMRQSFNISSASLGIMTSAIDTDYKHYKTPRIRSSNAERAAFAPSPIATIICL